MAITSIGNDGGNLLAAELMNKLAGELAEETGGAHVHGGRRSMTTDAAAGVTPAAMPQRPAEVASASDIATVLMAEVATADLTKLTTILQPENADNLRILDSLLRNAIQEVAKGNDERAIGYLADYATRDPRRAEALPLVPALEPVLNKVDSMMNRLTVVAKMSAEDSLSRAEQASSLAAGKLSDWETHSDVLLKLAHRMFEAGGYANYSRTAELARMVSAGAEPKPMAHALAASASASASSMATSALVTQMMPGINGPYWASKDIPIVRPERDKSSRRRFSVDGWVNARRNLHDLREIALGTIAKLWYRAPLLVIMLAYLGIGLAGGLTFALASRVWPYGLIASVGNLCFDLWGIGFLAIVGFGFYARVRYSAPRRS